MALALDFGRDRIRCCRQPAAINTFERLAELCWGNQWCVRALLVLSTPWKPPLATSRSRFERTLHISGEPSDSSTGSEHVLDCVGG